MMWIHWGLCGSPVLQEEDRPKASSCVQLYRQTDAEWMQRIRSPHGGTIVSAYANADRDDLLSHQQQPGYGVNKQRN